MAFGYFMNMEKLSLMIAEQHIENMTDNNYYEDDDIFLDPDRLTNNIANGFVVITQLSCFFESFLNTIINACMNYNGNALLKCSQEEKLDLIFMHYQKDFAEIRGQNPWAVHQKVTKVRNEMIHYKKTDIGMSTGIPDFQLGKQRVAEFFTKKTMGNVKNEYIKLTDLIAEALGLKVFKEIGIFECDGRDGLVNYVYDEEITEIDETRFEESKE